MRPLLRICASLCLLFSSGVYAPLVSAEDMEGEAAVLGEVTVTGTREEATKAETPATVGVVKSDDIKDTKPAHPSEIMRRVPGVHVAVTGGEGHTTAIRQPITTKPVYLYLEDGIPTRSTGFFNHNALYELNVPQAESIEVTKGPGTALYGSDAIGGIINVTTRPAPLEPEMEATVEAGSYGWWRGLVTMGNTFGNDGFRLDLNATTTDGWRDSTEYDRQGVVLRWDRAFSAGATMKTLVSYSNIDQQTAGSSAISRKDYKDDPEKNYTPISYRLVEALRVSSAFEMEKGPSLVSVTPYARHNEMEILPNWSLGYDPQKYTTSNDSVGLLLKYRRDFEPMRTRLIVGADADWSPGDMYEQKIAPKKTGGIYTSYETKETTYDYDVAFTGASPYLHAEFSPLEKMRVEAGLRYDYMRYDYDNNLSTVTTGKKRRPGDTDVDFERLSPKVGVAYAFAPQLGAFASYREAFRVPSEGQLFRQGQAEDTVGLDPVKARSYEAGIRGDAGRLGYEVSYYYMEVEDDVVSFKNTLDNTTETMNAGETLHKGVEAAVGVSIVKDLRADVSWSHAEHTYEEWSPKTGIVYDGNDISKAPDDILSARLAWAPAFLNGGRVELEWERLGEYWMDDENTHEYDGHDLVNVRASWWIRDVEVFVRAMNVTDERYATGASYSTASGEEFSPGMPATFYGGITYRFL